MDFKCVFIYLQATSTCQQQLIRYNASFSALSTSTVESCKTCFHFKSSSIKHTWERFSISLMKCLVLYLKRNSRLSAKSHLLWKAEFEIKMHILCRMAPSKNTYSFKDMPLSHLKNGMVDKCWNMTGTWYVKCFLLWFGRWDSGEICITIYKYQVFQNSYYRHQNTFLTLLILSLKLFC